MTVWLVSRSESIRALVEAGTKAEAIVVFSTGEALLAELASGATEHLQMIFVDLTSVPDAYRLFPIAKAFPVIARVPSVAIAKFGEGITAESIGAMALLQVPFSAFDVSLVTIPLLQKGRW